MSEGGSLPISSSIVIWKGLLNYSIQYRTSLRQLIYYSLLQKSDLLLVKKMLR